jgi:hypothetical protein
LVEESAFGAPLRSSRDLASSVHHIVTDGSGKAGRSTLRLALEKNRLASGILEG